jgi:hypothetical protein
MVDAVLKQQLLGPRSSTVLFFGNKHVKKQQLLGPRKKKYAFSE